MKKNTALRRACGAERVLAMACARSCACYICSFEQGQWHQRFAVDDRYDYACECQALEEYDFTQKSA